MPIPKKRDDTLIKNIPYLPKEITNNYRSDTTIGRVLSDYKVTTLGELKRKLQSGR
ncbi:MAG: hypothetical protein ACREAK_10990 [Nitrosarchaeum sp.]